LAKRNTPRGIRTPPPPKAQEAQLGKALESMVKAMSQDYRKRALLGLGQDTVEQFEDAAGNYADVFLKLAKRITASLKRQYSDSRIEQLVKTVLNKANRHNRDELYKLVEKRMGISTTELTTTEGLKSDVDALALETTQWVRKLRDDTLELYTTNSLRAMTQGLSLPEILTQFDGLAEKRKNHAKFTARNQIVNFNSISTKLRAQKLGVTEAIWRSAKDEVVRPSHEDREGKVFSLDKGCYSALDGKWLLPGTDYQCRCTYELIIPDDES
jgi:SPP1 gp7 family putative phage head morphogenesis protein